MCSHLEFDEHAQDEGHHNLRWSCAFLRLQKASPVWSTALLRAPHLLLLLHLPSAAGSAPTAPRPVTRWPPMTSFICSSNYFVLNLFNIFNHSTISKFFHKRALPCFCLLRVYLWKEPALTLKLSYTCLLIGTLL